MTRMPAQGAGPADDDEAEEEEDIPEDAPPRGLTQAGKATRDPGAKPVWRLALVQRAFNHFGNVCLATSVWFH